MKPLDLKRGLLTQPNSQVAATFELALSREFEKQMKSQDFGIGVFLHRLLILLQNGS